MRGVRTALAAGLALMVVAGVLVLCEHPLVVLASNSIAPNATLGVASNNATACQGGERLPAGTRAIRLSLWALTGPAIKLSAFSGGHLVTSGERSSGWDGERVTVPVSTVLTPAAASICFAIPTAGVEHVTLFGSDTNPAAAAHAGNGQALAGRLRIEYLGRGHSSWLALLPSVASHMGRGRAWSGIWVVYVVVLAMLAVTGLVSRLITRELHA
ncbi:MAG TPA: hypothetical protein VIH71_06270 [Solirubrobacteraceae bacterium]